MPVKIISPTIRSISNPNHNRQRRIPSWFLRLLLEAHPRLVWSSPAFSVIAPPTGGRNVLPGFLATFGDRHHMIKGQVFSPELFATVLTRIFIASKNINSGKLYGSMSGF